MDITLFSPDIGHIELQQKIITAWQQNRLPHAFLFYGPEGCGKDAFAIALAQFINTATPDGIPDTADPQYLKIAHLQHPDVNFIFPTPASKNVKDEEIADVLAGIARNPFRRSHFPGKNTFIGIDTIRELKNEARFKLYEGRKKIFIISQADHMRVEAANALLKLLEEPPDNLMLILTTSNIHQILPTIKSRCQLMTFHRYSRDEMEAILRKHTPEIPPEELSIIIPLSGYNLKRAFEFLEKDVLSIREQAIEFLRKVVLIRRSQELFAIIESLTAKKDREDARLLLWFLLLWFQDILYIKTNTVSEDALYNTDKIDALTKFYQYLPDLDIAAVVWEIETALQNLNDIRNFNPLLIFTTLAIKLHQQLKR